MWIITLGIIDLFALAYDIKFKAIPQVGTNWAYINNKSHIFFTQIGLTFTKLPMITLTFLIACNSKIKLILSCQDSTKYMLGVGKLTISKLFEKVI